ncbi:MAG: anaerobic ribonucleoside-triphosphate reductase activating protein [Lachnospiraceae bacterium]|nr:anaerobic ribonucleoside-triphosphate reductase activating protein [Lachnospiraceae bacterium]
MNYATIKDFDVANGPGVRVSLFVSGCHHKCKNCFNREAWDFNYGNPFTEAEINHIIEALKPDYIHGLSLLGGEPMEAVNQQGLLPLVKKVKELYPEKDIWCYTGFDFEKDILGDMFENNPVTKELVEMFDIMVDGKFVEELKNLSLRFRGSSNQRIIDVQKTLASGELVHWDMENLQQ